PSVTAAWAKPEPDGWTLRLHETLGRRGTLTLRLADGVTATRTDLRGHKPTALPDAKIDVRPHELISVKLTRKSVPKAEPSVIPSEAEGPRLYWFAMRRRGPSTRFAHSG
ncbi:MAG: hypothetical protein AAF561_01850, partial [Planctomycetota bacterium]